MIIGFYWESVKRKKGIEINNMLYETNWGMLDHPSK
jgi:hypothetical protein